MSWFNFLKKEHTYIKFFIKNGEINLEYAYHPDDEDEFLFMIATLNLGGLEETLVEALPKEIQEKYIKLLNQADFSEDSPVIQPYQSFHGKNIQ